MKKRTCLSTQWRFLPRASVLRAWTCLTLLGLPVAGIEYARGFSIPPREPPTLSSESGAGDTALSQEASKSRETEPDASSAEVLASDQGVGASSGDESELAAPSTPNEASAALDSAGASLETPGAETADAVNAAESTASADAENSTALPAPESVTIIVGEPAAQVMRTETQTESAAAVAAASDAITEIHPPAADTPMAAQVLQDAQKTRRPSRRAKPALLARAAVVGTTTQTRGLGKFDQVDERPVSAPTSADVASSTLPGAQLLGGRGVAQVADLGFGSPMTGAAADVFADGHHVVTRVTCEHYRDNPYFDQDPFGNKRPAKCP
jgi:hypothetical protein